MSGFEYAIPAAAQLFGGGQNPLQGLFGGGTTSKSSSSAANSSVLQSFVSVANTTGSGSPYTGPLGGNPSASSSATGGAGGGDDAGSYSQPAKTGADYAGYVGADTGGALSAYTPYLIVAAVGLGAYYLLK